MFISALPLRGVKASSALTLAACCSIDPLPPPAAALAAVSEPKASPAAAITAPASIGHDRLSRLRSRGGASFASVEGRFMTILLAGPVAFCLTKSDSAMKTGHQASIVTLDTSDTGRVDLFIDTAGRQGLSEQLYEQIRGAIAAGRLRPGDQLPPSPGAARQLGLPRTSGAKAYGRPGDA